MHEIVVSVQVKMRIPVNKKLTVGNVATAVHGLEIEKMLAEDITHTIDKDKVEEYCGPANARGNGGKRYRRAGTKERHPATGVGKLDLKLHRAVDTHTSTTSRPLGDMVEFEGQKVYQEDVSMVSAELATKMSYRDAATEGGLFTRMPSPGTINRRLIG